MERGELKVKRVRVAGAPVDAVDPEMALRAAEALLETGEHHQIVLLSTRGVLRARRDPELARCLREAALVLPVSRGVVRGARFLGTGELSLANPFEFVIRLLSMVERLKGSVYLIGARKDVLEVAEQNLRGSFHGIRVVGRYSGFHTRAVEPDIVTAIKKSSPTLVLGGTGLAGRERWLLRHKKELNPGLSLWADNCFEIFAGVERQVPRGLHRAGLDALSGFWRSPWRVVQLLPWLRYQLLLVACRLFHL